MIFKFLGTGTSVGVPQIGCSCKVCTSADFRDKRRRCGAYVSTEKGAFLLDTPPELREACVEYGISKVDAVVLTHAHMDHVAAFDDVRRFNTLNGGVAMNCYCSRETEEQMHRIFPYIGNAKPTNGLFRPQIDFVNDDVFEIAGVRVERLKVEHGFPCSGYKIGNLAYISDCHVIPEETLEKLHGVEVMVLNCLREREHPTHLNFERAKAYLETIAPKQAYLIHMCHDFSHAEWLEKLRGTNIAPAYDGLEITL